MTSHYARSNLKHLQRTALKHRRYDTARPPASQEPAPAAVQGEREALALLLVELAAHLLPPGGRIVDVGGGDGLLSRLFVQHGYQATLFDPRYACKHPVPGPPPGVDIEARRFHTPDARCGDLIIAYHACGATPAVARVRSRPVILVPCGEWYWWMRGWWMNRRHAVVPFGRSRRDVAFVSLG